MASRERIPNNFEDRFFDLLEDTIGGIDKKVDKLVTSQEATNRRMDKLERKLKAQPKVQPKAPPQPASPWYNDRILLYLALGSIFLFISIVAASRGIGVPKP